MDKTMNESDDRRRKRRLLVVLLLVLMVGVGIYVLSEGWKDPRARKGYYEGKSDEEITEDLSAQVDWYSMAISVASTMEVYEGQTRVEARIENLESNHCDQKVRIFETGKPQDVLFESGAIAPGEYLQYIDLAHPLAVGSHNLTVEFQGYDQSPALVSDEGKVLGHNRFGTACAAEVKLNVWQPEG